jgi:hypothetical protein
VGTNQVSQEGKNHPQDIAPGNALTNYTEKFSQIFTWMGVLSY